MTIRVVRPGILSTVQDLGRPGYRRWGVSPGGAMDQTALRLANLVVGNPDASPAIEMHFPAAEFVFDEPKVIALGGADFGATLDGREIGLWRAFMAGKGQSLRFNSRRNGARCYMAVRGGINARSWLNSCSTDLLTRLGGRLLRTDDRIESGNMDDTAVDEHCMIARGLIPHYSRFPTVRVVIGPESDRFGPEGLRLFFAQDLTVDPGSNRMGCLLRGEPIAEPSSSRMASTAVTSGTIQVLPSGSPVVLMADHQTTGGYPRIGWVIERDLPLLAQLNAGDKVAFHEVGLDASLALKSEFERDIAILRAACSLRRTKMLS